MAMGELATAPVKNRNTSKAGQFGARAQAMVKIVNTPNVTKVRFLRPKCSLKGPPWMTHQLSSNRHDTKCTSSKQYH